jgi:hypothetical protein
MRGHSQCATARLGQHEGKDMGRTAEEGRGWAEAKWSRGQAWSEASEGRKGVGRPVPWRLRTTVMKRRRRGRVDERRPGAGVGKIVQKTRAGQPRACEEGRASRGLVCRGAWKNRARALVRLSALGRRRLGKKALTGGPDTAAEESVLTGGSGWIIIF